MAGGFDGAVAAASAGDVEHKPLAGDMESNYGTEAGASKKPVKRHTFTEGETEHKSKFATWTLEDGDETMDDVSIVINLLADMSPAGILPLSFGMIGTGYLPAMVLLFLFAVCSSYMLYLLSRVIQSTGANSFDRMWSKLMGESTAWVPTFTVVLVTFGCCLAYACMFGDLFAGCMPAFGVTFASRTVCLIILAIFPVLPLCMLKDLSMLAPTSFGALAFVIYTIGMMAMRYFDGSYFEGGQFYDVPPPPAGDHMMTMGVSSLLLVNGLAVAFLCHYNGCKYYREFKEHTPTKFSHRSALSFSMLFFIFAIAMLAGYATFGSLSDGVILNNYAATDTAANIARFGMGWANVFSFPLMFSGLREQSLALMVFCSPSMEATTNLVWFQNTFSAVMLVIITILAILITDCSIVVGVVGSTCGVATIYVIPCVLFDAALGETFPTERILARVIASIGVFLMFAGLYATLAI